ncbi:hypothetical protein RBU55_18785 [Pseudomonas chlororaphis subsp. aurantiaca]|uniref:hypothetical protein n=1 Tax=Pseudomonas chlororaphis TaxID=587753 RepID=UPI0027DB2B0E|nr:hypothetical protein [Pseudomonas chlororaphis]WMI97608.1 hypothetical protein RBU55_18785 [Pseudomonas chlororaphis subsp. aurantiaca]
MPAATDKATRSGAGLNFLWVLVRNQARDGWGGRGVSPRGAQLPLCAEETLFFIY